MIDSYIVVVMSALYVHFHPNNVTTLIVNNFYTLEPISIIFGTLYAEIAGF